MGGVGGSDNCVVHGVLSFGFQNIRDQQRLESTLLVEAAGQIVGPDAVERYLACTMRAAPIQGRIKQCLSGPTASPICLDEQGVDFGRTMAALFEFGDQKWI